MAMQAQPALRWIATPVLTFLAGVIALGIVWTGFFVLLHHFVGLEYGAASWAAKSATTPFVTAVLVYAAWHFAPAKKKLVGAIALAVACAWAGAFIVGGILDSHTPLYMMGALGVGGGIGTYLILRARSLPEGAA